VRGWRQVLRGLFAMAVAIVAVSSCSTAPARFYALESTAALDGTPAASMAVMVGPVSVPAAVDQPQFVVEVAANRVELEEFNRWSAPLGDEIVRAVATAIRGLAHSHP
jgi:uncharacterized protein